MTRRTTSVFRHILGTDPRVSEYQVRQTACGADGLAVGDPDTDALASVLADALRTHGLSGPAVAVRIVDRLQRHESTGKLKRFVPLP